MIDRCSCTKCGIEYGADAPYEISKKFIDDVEAAGRDVLAECHPDAAAIYLGAYCYSCAKNYLDTIS